MMTNGTFLPIQFVDQFSSQEGIRRAQELFARTFSDDPLGVWGAPGRVNLIGEHTDYNAGLCLPIALPHRTFVALRPRGDNKVRLVSDLMPDNVSYANLTGLRARGIQGWSAYPLGVAWALQQLGFNQVLGFDAALVSCVPLSAGLSSSAAMTCSTALALDDVFGLGFGSTDQGRLTLIQASIRAENDMAGASTGGMDQSASMRCQQGHALLLDCRPELSALESATQEPFDLERNSLELLVVDTQAQHQLNDGQYGQRRISCEAAAELLGVSSLRVVADRIEQFGDPAQALDDTLNKLDDHVMKNRVRHVVTEIHRVRDFLVSFEHGDVDQAGALLDASHQSLAEDYEVSVPELDLAVEVARRQGAHGARMTGGGFGGSIIALVDRGSSRKVAQAIADEFGAKGLRPPRALVAVASEPASREA